MNSVKSFISKHKYALAFIIITLIQLVIITYTFDWQREGYHSDENWSYGFANSYYQTHIFQDSEGNLINYNQWVSSQAFRDYIEVQNGETFAFDSVLFNMSKDLNPPFHSLVLHAICSFFPDTFSWWHAYLINIFSFILAMLFLYLFGKEFFSSNKMALALCFFYGFTTAALNTYIYLRSYAFVTAMAILLSYLHCYIYRRHFSKILPQLLVIYFTIILGCLNHYYFFALAFCFAAIFCIYLLLCKKWLALFSYAFTMLISVFTIFIIYPESRNLLLSGNDIYDSHFFFSWEIKRCIYFLFGETTGLPIDGSKDQLLIILFFTIVLIFSLFFLLRKEVWFLRFKKRLYYFFHNIPANIPHIWENCDKFPIMLFLIVSTCLVIIAKISNIHAMGPYADRYLFILMPLFTAIWIRFLAYIAKKISGRRHKIKYIIVFSFLFSSLALNHILFPCNYLFERECNGPSIPELTRDANVIFITSADWQMVSYSSMLRNSKNFFAVFTDQWDKSMASLEQLPNADSPVYLIIEQDAFRSEASERHHMTESERLYENATTIDSSPSQIAEKYSACSWSTMHNPIQTEYSFCGKLSIWQLR